MNKKGFSLLELIVAVAILAIIAAVLAPTMTQTQYDAKEKMDMSAMENLASTAGAAVQQSNVFKDAKKISDKTNDKTIYMYFKVNEDYVVEFDYSEVNLPDGKFTTKTNNPQTKDLKECEEKILNYINGVIEPIEMQSKYYQLQKYKVIIKFTDVDFKVNSSLEVIVVAE